MKILKKLLKIIFRPSINVSSGIIQKNKLIYQIEVDGSVENLFFMTNKKVIFNNNSSPALLLVILQAMRRRRKIRLNDPNVSDELIRNLDLWMCKFSSWFKIYKPIEISNIAFGSSQAGARNCKRVAVFFSGGVDSFHTLLAHKNEITDLVFVHGFDVHLSNIGLKKQIDNMGADTAEYFGMDYISLSTNARKIQRKFGHWGEHGHGIALAAVGRALEGYIRKIFISSSFSQYDLFPWGTHPELDFLLGDNNLEINHYGNEMSRTDKIKYITNYPEALKFLRVCYKNNNGKAYNCCECEKCLRTMTSLFALNCLDSASTFPLNMNLEKIKSLNIGLSAMKFLKENLILLKEKGYENSEIYNAWASHLFKN